MYVRYSCKQIHVLLGVGEKVRLSARKTKSCHGGGQASQ